MDSHALIVDVPDTIVTEIDDIHNIVLDITINNIKENFCRL